MRDLTGAERAELLLRRKNGMPSTGSTTRRRGSAWSAICSSMRTTSLSMWGSRQVAREPVGAHPCRGHHSRPPAAAHGGFTPPSLVETAPSLGHEDEVTPEFERRARLHYGLNAEERAGSGTLYTGVAELTEARRLSGRQICQFMKKTT